MYSLGMGNSRAQVSVGAPLTKYYYTMDLHVLTRYTREQKNLAALANSISWHKSADIQITWYIIAEAQKAISVDVAALGDINIVVLPVHSKMEMETGLNLYLEVVPDTGQFIHILDDDNLYHPELKRLLPTVGEDTDMLVVRQLLENGQVRAAALAVEQVDMAQFVVRRTAVGALRFWKLSTSKPRVNRCDGYFCQEVAFQIRDAQKKKVRLDRGPAACYYNGQHYAL